MLGNYFGPSILVSFLKVMGVHNSQTPMQWPKMIGSSRRHQQRAIVCPPPLSTQCPGETTSLSLLAGTAASGSLRRPISQSHHHGNGSWRAGRLARPGPPSPRPLPWGGVQGEGMGAEKSAPPPLPSQEARARVRVHRCPASRGVGVPSPPSWVAPPPLHRLRALGHPFSRGKFVGAPPCALPSARSRPEGTRHPPPAPRTLPPSLSPTWMYAIFALAHSLRPGHGAATATLPSPTGEGGESKGGKEEKGSRVAPDVTSVADERRPPLRRPPRPCLSPRSGSQSRGRLPGWESWGAQSPRLGHPRCPALPPRRCPGWKEAGAPGAGAWGGRGDCSDPGAGGAGDAGAGASQRRGRGWGRGRCAGQPIRSAPGLAPTESRAPGTALKPRGYSPASCGVWSGKGPPHPALSQSGLEKLYSRPTRRA